MGISRRGNPGRMARPKPTCTNIRLEPIPGVEIIGIKPMVIAYIKTGSKRLAKDFAYHCEKLGIFANKVQDFGLELTVYELVGAPAALDTLLSRDCVKEFHLPMSGRVPFIGQGTGAEKPYKKPIIRENPHIPMKTAKQRKNGYGDNVLPGEVHQLAQDASPHGIQLTV